MEVNVTSWATAISTHSEGARKIFWRFAQTLNTQFHTRLLPDRIIVVWRYESETGQPLAEDYSRMSALEDLLEQIMESGRFATLALVSTGEGSREWTYYAKSGVEFLARLNTALHPEPVFPVEIHVASDPTWSTYYDFMAGIKTN